MILNYLFNWHVFNRTIWKNNWYKIFLKRDMLWINELKNVKSEFNINHDPVFFFSVSFRYQSGAPSWLGTFSWALLMFVAGLDCVDPKISLISSIALFICCELVGPRVKSINIFWIFWILYLLINSLWMSFSAYYSCLDIVRCSYLILL